MRHISVLSVDVEQHECVCVVCVRVDKKGHTKRVNTEYSSRKGGDWHFLWWIGERDL